MTTSRKTVDPRGDFQVIVLNQPPLSAGMESRRIVRHGKSPVTDGVVVVKGADLGNLETSHPRVKWTILNTKVGRVFPVIDTQHVWTNHIERAKRRLLEGISGTVARNEQSVRDKDATPLGASASFAERAKELGVLPTEKLSAKRADILVGQISKTMGDIFADDAAALAFLEGPNFGKEGESAREMLRRGRLITVLARIDELRFGSQG